MTCEKIQRKLSAFLDNELKEEETRLIREHLKECRVCTEALQAMGSAWDFVETAEGIEPSPYFWTRLSARIAQQEKEKTFLWKIWKRLISNPIPAAAAAALILGLLLGNFVGRTLYPNGSYASTEATAEALALTTFDDMPSGSLSEAYFSLLYEGEEQ